MSDRISCNRIMARLGEQRWRFGVLPLQGDASILISERGGRTFGPFHGPDSESVFWMNPVITDRGSFAGFAAEGNWNLGGEQVIGRTINSKFDSISQIPNRSIQ